MIYMLLQPGMFYYMLGQLHAYYIILHAFTVDSMQLQPYRHYMLILYDPPILIYS